MQQHFTNSQLLAEAIKRAHPKLVAIDGYFGAGKSTLSFKLHKLLGGSDIHLDYFLQHSSQAESGAVNLSTFQQRMIEFRRNDELTLFEGVRALDYLGELGLKPDVHVYVKRQGCNGDWGSNQMELGHESLEKAKEEIGKCLWNKMSPFSQRVVEYHYEKQPHRIARFLYIWS